MCQLLGFNFSSHALALRLSGLAWLLQNNACHEDKGMELAITVAEILGHVQKVLGLTIIFHHFSS